jgi:hypothetical protein
VLGLRSTVTVERRCEFVVVSVGLIVVTYPELAAVRPLHPFDVRPVTLSGVGQPYLT